MPPRCRAPAGRPPAASATARRAGDRDQRRRPRSCRSPGRRGPSPPPRPARGSASWCAAAADRAQRGQVEARDGGWCASAASSGGATSACAPRWVLHRRAAYHLEVEARQRDHRAAARQPVIEHATQAHAVEERREAEHALALVRSGTRRPSARRSPRARAWVSWTRLRQAGRAARGEQERDVVGVRPRAGGGPAAAITAANDGSPSTSTSSTPAARRPPGDRRRAGPTVTTHAGAVRRSCARARRSYERARRRDGAAGAQAAVEDRRRTPGMFGRCSASTSPRPKPRGASPAATRSTPPASSP